MTIFESTDIAAIRNVALVGASATGKTTLTEALLLRAGAIKTAGCVERGSTVSDHDPLEKRVQHSLNTANLVTGDKLDVVEDVAHGHRNRVERASKVAVRPPILLAGFAFDPGKLDAETRRDFTP